MITRRVVGLLALIFVVAASPDTRTCGDPKSNDKLKACSPFEPCVVDADCLVGKCEVNKGFVNSTDPNQSPSTASPVHCSTGLAIASLNFFFWFIFGTWTILFSIAVRGQYYSYMDAKNRAARVKKKLAGKSEVKRQDNAKRLPGVAYVKRVAALVSLSEGYKDYIEDAAYQMTAITKLTHESRTEITTRFRVLCLVFHRLLQDGRWVDGVVGPDANGSTEAAPEHHEKKEGARGKELARLEEEAAKEREEKRIAIENRTVGGTQQAFRLLEEMKPLMLKVVQAPSVDEVETSAKELGGSFDELMALLPEFDADLALKMEGNPDLLAIAEQSVLDDEYFFDKSEHGRKDVYKKKKKRCCPAWLQIDVRHKAFYIVYFGGYFLICLSHVIFRQVEKKEGNESLAFTFLGLGAAYDLDNNLIQVIFVPVIYGVMHASLFTFTLLPVPFARGLWRDFVRCAPGLRNILPVDDLIQLHRMWGIILLSGILTGASIWIVLMGGSCIDGIPKSCFAFHPKVNFYFDPIENVLFLRMLVWLTWFFIIPLMEVAREKPPTCCAYKCQQYFWEICIYSHVFIAFFILSAALIARFAVFACVITGWGLYVLDKLRERFLHTHKVGIVIKIGDNSPGTSRIHLHSKNNLPVSVHTVLTLPKQYRSAAGQWIYIHVPGVDRTWHPFTLASASDSPTINLEIGIRGYKDQWAQTKNDLGAKEWVQPTHPTWTFKLFRLIRHTLYQNRQQRRQNGFAIVDSDGEDETPVTQMKTIHLDAYVRGPYGAAYEQCLEPKFGASVLVGAGTGVTSALSAVRDIIARRRRSQAVPELVWFVWSTQSVDDLLWLWDSMQRTIYEACKDGILDPVASHRRGSKTLDWLGLTVYLSQADPQLLVQFVESTRPLDDSDLTDEAQKEMLAFEEENGNVGANTADQGLNALQDGAAALSTGVNAISTGVTAGVTAALSIFKTQKKTNDATEKAGRTNNLSRTDVHNWMTDDKRLLINSMDDKGTHIAKLLKFVKNIVGSKPVSVAYCGPAPLSFLLADACKSCGPEFDFVSDCL